MQSLRSRIVAAFVMALVPAVLAMIFVVWSQSTVQATLHIVTDAYLPVSRGASELQRDRDRMHSEVMYLLSDGRTLRRAAPTSFSSQKVRKALDISWQLVENAEDRVPAEERPVLAQMRTYLRNVDALLDDYESKAEDLIAQHRAGEEIGEREVDYLERRNRGIQEETQRVLDSAERSIARITRSAEEAQSRIATMTVAASLAVAVLAVVLVFAVTVQLRPIGKLTAQVQRVAAGEPGERVDVAGSNEMAVLATEFNAMVQTLEARDRALVERAEELRRLYGYLESVLDSLDDGLMVVESGRITLSNPAAMSRWGAHSARPAPAPLDEIIASPGRHEVAGPNHTLHEVRVAPFGEDGVVLVSADITEASFAKERLARSERLALVGQMLAQITHEVRNPLNALSLNTELLADELADLDPERKTEAWEIHETIAGEIERLTAVTGHYLQLARRPAARLQSEDLGTLLEDVVRLLDAELEQRGVKLVLATGDVGLQRVDGNQLRQALLNIVRNATEAGATTLYLRCEREGREVEIAIADNGPGMSEEERARAFDPFFSTKASGTGLGLAITRQILEDHDGTVRVESSEEGTTITLVLPDRPGQPETPADDLLG
ncbi:MAG: HAMP domain-containing sensor histidine kinase [Deltaproteobacteria bacterium]|nr:MAG: HAMP domain-containing sensor histidine kinase [Deltaproteobacteria bacterium]